MNLDQDAIILGGGPAGSCAASYLARSGYRVLLLEKERFPRFHIGESLLPYNHSILSELGLIPQLEAAGFPVKRGAQFHLGNGSKSTGFVFRNGRFTKHTEAFQVERSRFDEILLRHASTLGVEVREEHEVQQVTADKTGVTVVARGNDATSEFRARFVIDATGRGNLTGNQEGIKEVNPSLRKLAVFGHFENVRLDSDQKGGDTVIVRLENKWFWLIPLALGAEGTPSKVSVGLVMDRDEFTASGQKPEEVFRHWVQQSPPVRERLEKAQPVSPIQVTSDFSYRNRTFWSNRVLRVGDAAGFIDPIFSSGVFLAMFSGKLGAEAVGTALKNGNNGDNEFIGFDRRVRAALKIYSEMVESFYTTPFMELFLEPRAKWELAAAVNAILAGELEGGWRLRWRMWLFFRLVRLQARFPLVPRISFARST